MQDYFLLIFVLVGIIFAVILFLLINKQKFEKINNLQSLSMMGFVRAERDLEFVTEIVRGLSRDSGSMSIHVKNLFLKTVPDGRLYMLDIVDRSESETLPFGELAILIVSNDMNLPRFSIYPKITLDGLLGDLTNNLLDHVYGKIGNVMEEWGDVEFDKRYVVLSDQEYEVEQVLTTRVIERFNGINGLALECNKNYILINQFNINGQKEKAKIPGHLIPTALKIHSWFTE